MVGIGAFLLWKSVDLGEAYANHWLRESGGHADMDTYHIILSEAIRMYRWAGAILFAIGIWFLRKEAMR
ncbi:hypothetical protein ETC01_17130 [Geobacillus sp. NFOSA3]|nr:hypothetical protein [Geobacillus sp. NFOSA3]OQP01248.1 hypothetical protein B1689_05955 [Geobacillus sp. 44C]QNU35952.1 hypothetical protein IC802_01330 [Geobacillus sp. 44C]